MNLSSNGGIGAECRQRATVRGLLLWTCTRRS